MYVGASMWCVLRLCLHVLLSFDSYVACHVSVDTSEMAKATTGMLRARQKNYMGGFGADASGGGSHGMWGSGGGVGGDVADLEGLRPQGCDERGEAGTLTCGNGPGNSFFTETALLDEVHSSRSRFWCARIALACGNGARKPFSRGGQ